MIRISSVGMKAAAFERNMDVIWMNAVAFEPKTDKIWNSDFNAELAWTRPYSRVKGIEPIKLNGENSGAQHFILQVLYSELRNITPI